MSDTLTLENYQTYNPLSLEVMRDSLFSIIKKFEESFPDLFERTGLKKCDKCEGTGLIVGGCNGLTLWKPGGYCLKCKGLGYLGIERVGNVYLCPNPNCSKKCVLCNGNGVVDWITYAMNKGKQND